MYLTYFWRFLAFFSLFYVMASMPAYADFGMCTYGIETLEAVTCFGPATLNSTTVTGKVFVTGPLTASNAKVGFLQVAGVATLNNSTINNATYITGPLVVNGGILEGSVFVAADKVSISATRIKGPVTIKSKLQTPYLDLKCGSQLESTVTFIGRPGVIRGGDVAAVKGKIINGQFVETQFPQEKCEFQSSKRD